MRRYSSIYLILAMLFVFLAGPMATYAAALPVNAFNNFLAAWLDVFFYILAAFFIALGFEKLPF